VALIASTSMGTSRGLRQARVRAPHRYLHRHQHKRQHQNHHLPALCYRSHPVRRVTVCPEVARQSDPPLAAVSAPTAPPALLQIARSPRARHLRQLITQLAAAARLTRTARLIRASHHLTLISSPPSYQRARLQCHLQRALTLLLLRLRTFTPRALPHQTTTALRPARSLQTLLSRLLLRFHLITLTLRQLRMSPAPLLQCMRLHPK
jgi:hypothetical protein